MHKKSGKHVAVAIEPTFRKLYAQKKYTGRKISYDVQREIKTSWYKLETNVAMKHNIYKHFQTHTIEV